MLEWRKKNIPNIQLKTNKKRKASENGLHFFRFAFARFWPVSGACPKKEEPKTLDLRNENGKKLAKNDE